MDSMVLPFGGVERVISGGPFKDAPGGNYFQVKLDPDIEGECDLLFPIKDFSVPEMEDAEVRNALVTVLCELARGKPVYIGCRGGKGRTGLFLALLAKALGVQYPVTYTRYCFNLWAVETEEQEAYVSDFKVWPMLPAVWILMARAWAADKGLTL